jgi:hypothetical protein
MPCNGTVVNQVTPKRSDPLAQAQAFRIDPRQLSAQKQISHAAFVQTEQCGDLARVLDVIDARLIVVVLRSLVLEA